MRGLKNNKGFSLVELIVVIAIIGVLTALAIPKLGASGSEAKVKAAARELVTNARYVRDQAITTGTDYTLTFNKDSGEYTYGGTVSGSTITTVKLPDDVIVSSPNYSVTFTPHGTTNNLGTVTLTSGSSSKSVKFSSSLVRIE